MFLLRLSHRRQLGSQRKNCWLGVWWERVISPKLHASRDLHVEVHGAAAVALHEIVQQSEPFRMCMRRIDPDLSQAAREPIEVLAKTEHAAIKDRQNFIHAVCKQESAIER